MPQIRPFITLTALMLASFACTVPLGGPAIPPDSAAGSPEAFDSFLKQWRELPQTYDNGQFTLVLNEEEVASAIDTALGSAGTEAEPNVPLHNTHVSLNGGIVLYTQTEAGLVKASGIITLRPSVDDNGRLAVEVESAEFGRASFNDAVLEQIANEVAAALTAPADNLPVSLVLTGVLVMEDELVLTGNFAE